MIIADTSDDISKVAVLDVPVSCVLDQSPDCVEFVRAGQMQIKVAPVWFHCLRGVLSSEVILDKHIQSVSEIQWIGKRVEFPLKGTIFERHPSANCWIVCLPKARRADRQHFRRLALGPSGVVGLSVEEGRLFPADQSDPLRAAPTLVMGDKHFE